MLDYIVLSCIHIYLRFSYSAYQVISNLSATTAPLFAMESWGRFPKERDRLFKLIADSKVISSIFKLFGFLLFAVSLLLVSADKLFCTFLIKETMSELKFT